jgi:predicted dehydrogenase
MVNDEIGIGIVGSGFMGRTYAETTTRYNRHARLIAISGGKRARGLAADYAVALEPTVESLMARADVDAVILTPPESVHLEHTEMAASAGKHILVEKPMAPDVAQCEAMIQACRDAKVTLMVVQSQRFRGVHQRAKRLLDEGCIGEVWQVRHWSNFPIEWTGPVVEDRPWYADPEGGLFLGQCVHNFDMMRWLVGSDAARVYADVTSHGDHGLPNLSVMAQVEFMSGATCQLWVCLELPGMVFPQSQFHSQVVGSMGLLDFDGYTYLDLAVDGAWRRIWEQPAFDPLDPMDPVRLESYAAQNQAFIESILEGRVPAVTGEDGRAAVELCQASMLSARSGQAIDLPL